MASNRGGTNGELTSKYLGKDAEIREPLERFERRARVPDPE